MIMMNLYTHDEAYEIQVNRELVFKDVVYYDNGLWVTQCLKDKFLQYFNKLGHNNVKKIYKTKYTRERN